MSERERFEEWARDVGYCVARHCVRVAIYESVDTQRAWTAWQAAKADNAALLAVANERLREVLGNNQDAIQSLRLQVAHLREALAATEGDGWRSMESAPRDGTPIRIRRKTTWHEEREHVVMWDEDHGENGWWIVRVGKLEHPLRGAEPDEWKPVPFTDAEGE
jgi:hypothetical protein